MSYPLFQNAFQLAYVTNDIDRAVEMFTSRYGVGGFHIMRDTPDADGKIHVALGYAGKTNIELIQPGENGRALYADWIADATSFVCRFHHVGLLIDEAADWDAMRQRVVENGSAIVMEGEVPDFAAYLYADTVAELGHYLEYVRLGAHGQAMFAGVPGFPGFPSAVKG